MRRILHTLAAFALLFSLASCKQKTGHERAIELVQAKYEHSDDELNFDHSKLDSLYTISPKAYADSLKKGNELDERLANLESEIEHYGQEASDSVGLISAALTKDRYRLLDVAKSKPRFIGWTLSGVKIENSSNQLLNFNFDSGITKIIP